MANLGMSLNCRDAMHATCTGCVGCACHAVPMPASIKALAHAISSRARAEMEAEAKAERAARELLTLSRTA